MTHQGPTSALPPESHRQAGGCCMDVRQTLVGDALTCATSAETKASDANACLVYGGRAYGGRVQSHRPRLISVRPSLRVKPGMTKTSALSK